MLRTRKNKLAASLFAMTALGLGSGAMNAVAGDSVTQVLNTSPIYSDSGQSYPACNASNVAPFGLGIKIEMLDSVGNVLATTGATYITIAASGTYELSYSGYTGFSRCRFTLAAMPPTTIRANGTVFHFNATYYESLAISEAR